MQKAHSLAKTPGAGKDKRPEEKGTIEDEMVGWHHHSVDMILSKLWKMLKDRAGWCAADHGVTKSESQLSD